MKHWGRSGVRRMKGDVEAKEVLGEGVKVRSLTRYVSRCREKGKDEVG